MFALDNAGFGECGMADCGSCAAMPTCPSAKQAGKKYKTQKMKVYRIRPVRGKKGLVTITPAGTIKCRTKVVVKTVKGGKGMF